MRADARWMEAGIDLLERIRDTQSDAIEQASRLCSEAIGAGGRAHLFGPGHSRIPGEEMFPRYGSYPGFHPIAELSMTFHTQGGRAEGRRHATLIARVTGR